MTLWEYRKIYITVPLEVYSILSVKTNGFKNIDQTIMDLLLKHYFDEHELSKIIKSEDSDTSENLPEKTTK
jgi:hypothetical protein